MQKTVSIKENRVFHQLYTRGKQSVDRYLAVYCRRNRFELNRLGFTVSVKMGKAVHRNSVRRKLREIYRLQEDSIEKGYDLVIVVRSRGIDATYQELEKSLTEHLKELGLISGELPEEKSK